MISDDSNSDGIVIKIPRSVLEQNPQPDTSETPPPREAFRLYEQTGVSVLTGTRNSEHGTTQIQTLAIPDELQRQKVLGLLNNPELYKYLPAILNYIYDLGIDRDGEKRYFAALALAELSEHVPFVDLKEGVIAPWAKLQSAMANNTAALTLITILTKEKFEADVLTLLKHWSLVHNLWLANTAVVAAYEIGPSFPDQVVAIARNILILPSRISVPLTPKVVAMLERVYLHEPGTVISALYSWFNDAQQDNLRIFAAIEFLVLADVKDLARRLDNQKKTLDFVYHLWNDVRIPAHQELQQTTTIAVKEWAKSTATMPVDDPDYIQCVDFFRDLYAKCAADKRNRLDYHLRRWQKQEDAAVQRNSKRNPDRLPHKVDYLSLIPS